MSDRAEHLDDGLGPDPVDRGSAKGMGGDSGGALYDPSYEVALRIMGREHEIPSPFEQRARVMDNPEAAELARRLTALRRTAGVGFGPFGALPTLGPPADVPGAGQAVETFIAALQEVPLDQQELSALRQQIEGVSADVQDTLALVCQHPDVQAKLAT